MKKFHKKYLKKPAGLFRIIKMVNRQGKIVKKIKPGEKISSDFEEKIMLAISGVNNCVYCSYLHTATALKKGVPEDEIIKLLNGELGDFPEEEAVALIYAQHWSENQGEPDKKSRKRMLEYYGEDITAHIEFIMARLFIGNMICNTVEAYKTGNGPDTDKFKFFLTVLLCRPIAFMIRIFGKKGKKQLAGKKISYL